MKDSTMDYLDSAGIFRNRVRAMVVNRVADRVRAFLLNLFYPLKEYFISNSSVHTDAFHFVHSEGKVDSAETSEIALPPYPRPSADLDLASSTESALSPE